MRSGCPSPPFAARRATAVRCAAVDTDAGSMGLSSERASPSSLRTRGEVGHWSVHCEAFRQSEVDGVSAEERLVVVVGEQDAGAEAATTMRDEVEAAVWEGSCAVDPDEWVPRAVLARKRYDGEPWLKVAWRWHAEPTWILEEDFVDAGHQACLDKFKPPPRAVRPCPAAAPRPDAALDPEQLWPDFRTSLPELFVSSQLFPTVVRDVMDADRLRRFRQRMLGAQESGTDVRPLMLTHGTEAANASSIIKLGLCMPGTHGVRVRNGSRFGVAIYTSQTPSDSVGFTRGANQMFVCAGLTCESTSRRGDYVMFTNPADVMPVFLVQYTTLADAEQKSLRCDYEYRASDGTSHDLPIPGVDPPEPSAPLLPPPPLSSLLSPPSADTTDTAATVRDQVMMGLPPLADELQRDVRACESHRRLSKRGIRQMPRWAKIAYRMGMLAEKSFRK